MKIAFDGIDCSADVASISGVDSAAGRASVDTGIYLELAPDSRACELLRYGKTVLIDIDDERHKAIVTFASEKYPVVRLILMD